MRIQELPTHKQAAAQNKRRKLSNDFKFGLVISGIMVVVGFLTYAILFFPINL